MRICYRYLCGVFYLYRKQVVLSLGLFALPVSLFSDGSRESKTTPRTLAIQRDCSRTSGQRSTDVVPASDPRVARLKKFFARLHCPVANLAGEFVQAADENHLDWRLLPSISVIESGGGKACRNNNIFGWKNGSEPFSSIRSGIHEVAFKLGRSPLYKNRDVAGKLRVYNPNTSYRANVMMVMNRIGGADASSNLAPTN